MAYMHPSYNIVLQYGTFFEMNTSVVNTLGCVLYRISFIS